MEGFIEMDFILGSIKGECWALAEVCALLSAILVIVVVNRVVSND